MVRRAGLLWWVVVVTAASGVVALSPGTDIVVPAAARTGPWLTDLYVVNTCDETVQATVYWLVRNETNPNPASFSVELAAGDTGVYEDVVLSGFGMSHGTGALRVVASAPVAASTRIYARQGALTYGQGFEGVPMPAALAEGGWAPVVGLSNSSRFRTNLYALAGGDGATFEATLYQPDGVVLAHGELELEPWEPILDDIGSMIGAPSFDNGTLVLRVSQGAAVIGASKVDRQSSDPTTLEPVLGLAAHAGTYYGSVIRDGGGAMGGIAVVINGSGAVDAFELSFPSDRCPAVFTVGQDLSSSPIPLIDFETGYAFESQLAEGTMQWILTLMDEGGFISGSIQGSGSGWTGQLVGCNGIHPIQDVRLGSLPP